MQIFFGLIIIFYSSREIVFNKFNIAKIFTQQAKRRINQNLRRLNRNEDSLMKKLADHIVVEQGYHWDIF